MRRLSLGGIWLLLFLTVSFASAADPAAAPPAQLVPRLTSLPIDHPYQKTLRDYLRTLNEKDFDHGVTAKMDRTPVVTDPEEQYRHYLLTLMLQPMVGTKRGAPSVQAPPKLFTLSEIETPAGVKRPPIWTEPLAQLVHWKYEGNPYYQSRAMKLRVFVTMVVNLTMLDEQLEHAPELGGSRSDWVAPSLIAISHPYATVSDVVPEPVRKAYLVGLEKMGRRILDWGPKGEEPNLDIITTVVLWYISQAVGDPEFSKEAEAYARRFFTDERYFHPAGYFVDRGGIDLGFAGQTNFFATWLALASKWPFAVDAVDRIYRLRAHVSLPDPDGKTVRGPSHYHIRYSAEAWRDQWEWGIFRDVAASLVTDEAAYINPLPKPEVLANAAAQRAGMFGFAIDETGYNREAKRKRLPEDMQSSPWRFHLWATYNFPATVNYAYDHYPAGAFARRTALEKQNSQLLKSPFLRDEHFVRDFGKAFFVTKSAAYAAIVHTGPVGAQTLDDSLAVLPGPYGFGGGQLSAFWTPQTGSVLLGRRGGMSWDKTFDNLEDWRKWPIHAVSGARTDGKVFTTGRIQKPTVVSDLKADGGTVHVSGVVPRGMLGQGKAVEGRLDYARIFIIAPDSLRVETKLLTTAQDNFAELYETLPIFLREGVSTPKRPIATTTIEFRHDKAWTTAIDQWTEGVTAVRLARFDGAVLIEFDRPRRVKLSDEWSDTYLSRVVCRNVMIDLIENKDQPQVVREVTMSFRIRPDGK